jgi:hypothetical protein
VVEAKRSRPMVVCLCFFLATYRLVVPRELCMMLSLGTNSWGICGALPVRARESGLV